MLQNISTVFQINDILFHQIIPKKYQGLHKNMKQHNRFNIDKNKCFLSSKLHQNDFWRIMWHWSNDAENSALITGINYISKYTN